MSRKDWAWEDGWPHHDPNANKGCSHCNGTGILFHNGVVSFEVECVCIPDRSEESKDYAKKIGIE